MNSEELKTLVAEINKEQKGIAIRFGSEHLLSDIDVFISTGSRLLDAAMGGGVPSGRMIEVFGDESAGKSTVACHMLIECQKMGGVAVLIDTESTFYKLRAEAMGLNLNDLLVLEAETVEQGFERLDSLLDKVPTKGPENMPIWIVWDTVSGSPTETEKEGDKFGEGIANRPRLVRLGLRRLAMELPRRNMSLIFVNQAQSTIGRFASKNDTNVGRGIKFHASIRMEVKAEGQFKETVEQGVPEVAGTNCEIQIVKNKVTRPYANLRLPIYSDKGIDDWMSILAFLVNKEVGGIQMSGAWPKFPGFDLVKNGYINSRESVRQLLANNPGLDTWLTAKMHEKEHLLWANLKRQTL